MLKYLLDTNAISEPARPSPNPGVLTRLERHEREIALAAPVWHELVFGLERLPPSVKRTRIEDYLFGTVAELPILSYDTAAAEWHARERARLSAVGKVPPFLDGQIASIAAIHSLVLVTANRAHFELFDELRIESWREPAGG
jgi:tRNA(fMet)-specific endonuclease VapC